MDLAAMFGLSTSPLELVVRGSAVYWFLFAIFRFVLRRDVGAIGLADVLLLVLIADASQNAMAGGYSSVTDGCILVGTIVGWNYGLDWAAYRFPIVRRWAEPPSLLLISGGRVLHRNLRREYITRDELAAKLREEGIESAAEVKRAYLESDGQISVIKQSTGSDDGGRKKRAGPPV